MTTSNEIFSIGAPGFDAAKIVESVRESVRAKIANGQYNDSRVARAEQANLANIKDEDEFSRLYMDCLREAVFVDINDFEILERRKGIGSALVALKKLIWKMLKFYTYRLWSQQNQVNGMLLAAMEGMEDSCTRKLRKLEERIRELEGK